MQATQLQAKFDFLLRLGDTALILSHRMSEWCGKGPALEEDMALANTALDLLGQARLWLSYAAECEAAGRDEDALAYLREERDFHNLLLVELPNGNYADTIVREFYFDAWHSLALDQLTRSSDPRISAIAAKSQKEVTYHLRRSSDLVVRMGDGTAHSRTLVQAAADALWPYTGEMFLRRFRRPRHGLRSRSLRSRRTPGPVARLHRASLPRRHHPASIARSLDAEGRQAGHPHRAPRLSPRRDAAPPAHPSGRHLVRPSATTATAMNTTAMNTTAMTETANAPPASIPQLWDWLAEVPDPEIPVLSVVDLGIIRNVAWSSVDPGLCLVTVTPTYSGCPATEVIGRMIRESLAQNGVPRVQLDIQLSPPWTTDWLTEKAHQSLRDYGIAPPIGRAVAAGDALSASLVVLGQGPESSLLACPRCASTNTEMISRFGSTPCKSLHRCLDCLEPFDHFKCH